MDKIQEYRRIVRTGAAWLGAALLGAWLGLAAPAASAQDGTALNPGGDPEPPIMQGMTGTHNQFRAAVGVPPLIWSIPLAAYAQEWADHLAADENCNLVHRPSNPYGENLSTGVNGDNGRSIALFLGEEQAAYDPRRGRCIGGQVCGHYTQMVWRETREIGCGVAYCPNRPNGQNQVWVCDYNPPGNRIGQAPF